MVEKFIDGIQKRETISNKEIKIAADPIGVLIERLEKEKTFPETKIDISYLDPNQRAETLWALYQELKQYLYIKSKKEGFSDLKQVEKKVALLKSFYNDSDTKDIFLQNYKRHYQEISQINGNWEKYQALDYHRGELQKAIDETAKEIFSNRGSGGDESDLIIFETTKNSLKKIEQDLDELTDKNPKLAALVQYENIKKESQELHEKGFIWSGSRKAILKEAIEKALSGSPLLFTGPSGTGKSSIVEQMALVLTNQPNTATPGKDVRFGDLIAKPKISPSGETYYEYKEIGEAATGKKSTLDKKTSNNGLVVADDEFNLMDQTEQNTRISRIYSWKPGKRVKMPVTNVDEVIAPNFLYCAMVNLASSKYKRQEIPVEVQRKFAAIDVPYIPQSNEEPELYEVLLAGLIDKNGRIRANKEELSPTYEKETTSDEIEENGRKYNRNIAKYNLIEVEDKNGRSMQAGGFLWRFANALNQMNKSFSNQETVLKSKAEAQYIQKLVIDIGKILGWMARYQEEGRGENLENFLIEKLKDEFLNKEAYPSGDRQLAVEFLNYYGIDVKNPPKGKKEFEILTPVEIGRMSPRVKYYEVLSKDPILDSFIVTIEGQMPFRVKRESYSDLEGRTFNPGDFIEDENEKVWEFIGVREDNNEPVFQEPEEQKTKKLKNQETKNTDIIFPDRAFEILGEKNFMGPSQVEKAFGTIISPEQIPPIPFSEAELIRAKELDQFLILRIESIDGKSLTMDELNNLIQEKLTNQDKGKLIAGNSTDWWFKEEAFFKSLNIKTSWALVSKNIIGEGPESKITETLPDGSQKPKYQTTSQNYFQQTETIIKYLQEQVFNNQTTPLEYQEAINEFNFQKAEIQKLMGENWQQAATKLKDLQITQFTRREASETTYDLAVYLLNTDEHLLNNRYDWGKTQSSDSNLVNVGEFDPGGADVYRYTPGISISYLGVSLSRTR